MTKVYYIDLSKDEINDRGYSNVWVWGKESFREGEFEVGLKDNAEVLEKGETGWLYVSSKDIIYKDKEDEIKMSKRKITREQERHFLELTDGLSKKKAINMYLHHKDLDYWKERLEWLDFDLLLELLVNGYEVEKSPEEMLAKYYESIPHSSTGYNEGQLVGIEKTLSILNIKIKGINE